MAGMNIIQTLGLMVHQCKVAFSDKKSDDLCNYLDRIVLPRLGS